VTPQTDMLSMRPKSSHIDYTKTEVLEVLGTHRSGVNEFKVAIVPQGIHRSIGPF